MHDGGSFPSSTRNRFYQPFPTLSPAANPRQIGLRAKLIHKYEPFGIHLFLTRAPSEPLLDYVRTILLGRTRSFF